MEEEAVDMETFLEVGGLTTGLTWGCRAGRGPERLMESFAEHGPWAAPV